MECWGAAGGTDRTKGTAGRGAYTSGDIAITKDENFYVFVGGRSVPYASSTSSGGGGWNGGGWGSPSTESGGYCCYGGGGATDIRLSGNTNSTWKNDAHLRSRIMVAAGGGGVEHYSGYTTVGGYAGGLTGGQGTTTNAGYSNYSTYPNSGASQIGTGSYSMSDDHKGAFGYANQSYGSGWGGGGGSGYWGGVKGYGQGGSGGSSYISGHAGCVAIASSSSTTASTAGSANSVERSKHYSGKYFTNTIMVDGGGYQWTTSRLSTRNVMPQTSGSGTENGHYDNGYCRITYTP